MENKNGFLEGLKNMLGLQKNENENLSSLIDKLRARRVALKAELDEAGEEEKIKELKEVIQVVDEQIKKCEKILVENNS
jgi:RNAse (barnase) inhibitor barstar